ncbi:MAG: hypothetical protein ABF306_01385 [Nocardioides marinisabuli]|uniref:hypothetical protein n=1 Tax=Nocardioides marinisabuli TaxID=419476 RepID=UPI003219975A
MTWEERLFDVLDDLEQQAEALYGAERSLELADRARAAYAEVSLASRLMAATGSQVRLEVRGVGALAGSLERVGQGWLLLRGPAQDWVVRTAALSAAHDLPERSVPEVAWPATARLGVGSALRRLADSGERGVLHLVDGSRHDGVPARVGADFVEVRAAGERVVLVALEALAAVQSRDEG